MNTPVKSWEKRAGDHGKQKMRRNAEYEDNGEDNKGMYTS